jgi:adenosylhomocysteine nucleosidase
MTMNILIQTALSLEFKAIKEYLNNNRPEIHPTTGSIYNHGTYSVSNLNYNILLVETGPGNVRAADETGRAIAYFNPDYVFFVGVAGGLKDVKIGDVVASTKVIGYEMGKDDITFKPRMDSMPSSYLLEQIAKYIKREEKWTEKISQKNTNQPEAFVQPIASGEKVVSSNKSVTFSYLKQFCSDAVAVDMEGSGFLIATRPYNVRAIEIRGISDLIEHKDAADASGSQPTAAANAAAFTFSMIDSLSMDSFQPQDTQTLEFRKKLVEELVKLYSQGPEQDDIWKRAGGDVSILTNSSSRKSQWFSAIEKLSMGGGGKNITIESLIYEVKSDYPDFFSIVF